MQKAKRLFITALFGSIIFVINVFLPSPINYILIVVQAVLLALSALFIGKEVPPTSAQSEDSSLPWEDPLWGQSLFYSLFFTES
jgi:hypothetical protein